MWTRQSPVNSGDQIRSTVPLDSVAMSGRFSFYYRDIVRGCVFIGLRVWKTSYKGAIRKELAFCWLIVWQSSVNRMRCHAQSYARGLTPMLP